MCSCFTPSFIDSRRTHSVSVCLCMGFILSVSFFISFVLNLYLRPIYIICMHCTSLMFCVQFVFWGGTPVCMRMLFSLSVSHTHTLVRYIVLCRRVCSSKLKIPLSHSASVCGCDVRSAKEKYSAIAFLRQQQSTFL